jgi:hypothetical protein
MAFVLPVHTLRPDRLMEFMNDALHNPAQPKACWNCLAGSFYMLVHPEPVFGPQSETDLLFGKTCNIWPTILRFITFPRTDQELASLVHSRKHCFCESDWEGAEIIRLYSRSVVTLWNTMWNTEEPAVASSPFHCFFSHVLKQLTPHLHDLSPTAVAKRRTEVWPLSPQDCIPFGAESPSGPFASGLISTAILNHSRSPFSGSLDT